MPIFEYRCRACRYSFDALQKAGEGALRKCPECGRLQLEKQTSAPSFHLKGAGWHKPAASSRKRVIERKGHVLDAGPAHSHDDHGSSHGHGHSHAGGGHTHSHGGHTHSHGPGHKHKH